MRAVAICPYSVVSPAVPRYKNGAPARGVQNAPGIHSRRAIPTQSGRKLRRAGPPRKPLASPDHPAVLVCAVEDLAPVGGDQDQVLHTHAHFAGQVDAGLDGKDHSFPRRGGVGAAHVPLLVLGAADEVPQPMGEVLAIARRRDQVAGGLVQLAQRHARAYQRLGGLVGTADQVVDGRVLVRDGPAEVGAGHVRAISRLFAADVQHDAVAGLQPGVVGHVVGVGGVGAKGDDGGEGRPFAAQFPILGQQVVGHLPLGHALADKGGGAAHDLVVQAGIHPHQLLFGRVLAAAHAVHTVAGQAAGGAGQPLHQGQQKAGGPFLVNAKEDARLHPLGHLADGVVGVGEPDLFNGRFRHREQLVQKEEVAAVGAQVQRKQPLKGFHIHAGQIVDALRVADDHLRQAALLHGLQHPVDPFHFHHDPSQWTAARAVSIQILARRPGLCKRQSCPLPAGRL